MYRDKPPTSYLNPYANQMRTLLQVATSRQNLSQIRQRNEKSDWSKVKAENTSENVEESQARLASPDKLELSVNRSPTKDKLIDSSENFS